MSQAGSLTTRCPRCSLVNYVPAELAWTPVGRVRCSMCGWVLKRDMRRWWQRLLHARID